MPSHRRQRQLNMRMPAFQLANRISSRYAELVTPRSNGLPNLLVVLWFPLLVLLATILLTVLGISGSSTGYFWKYFGTGTDPNLIWGTPRGIRGDEWWVQSAWVVSQYQQGFPVTNNSFPGGISALLYNDSPSWHWSMIFRPHAAGMLFLPLDQGMALRWWLPLAATAAAAYVFCVSLLPKRPLSSAALAAATAFSPMIMWWFLPSNIWPVAWGFSVLAAVVISLKARKTITRIVPAAIAGYLTVTMAMSLYVPYIVAIFLPVLLISIGLTLGSIPGAPSRIARRFRTLIPLAVAGLTSIVITGYWLFANRDAVSAMLNTVYPGARDASAGLAGFQHFIRLMSSPFQTALQTQITFLGTNQSEASAPIVLSVFLCIPLAWLTWRRWKSERRFDWLCASIVIGNVAVFAWMFVPGWDWLANLLLLNRTTTPRIWYSFIILTLAAVVVVFLRTTELKIRTPWPIIAVTGAAMIGTTTVVWFYLRQNEPEVLSAATSWKLLLAGQLVAALAVLRRHLATTAVAFLAVTLAVSAGVNPLYRGVFNLNDTEVGQQVSAIHETDPEGSWVNVGEFLPMTILFESGVPVYGGVQTYPSAKMWSQIDPTGTYENTWNRLAHIKWTPGSGEPVVSLTRADQVLVTFDSCSAFAQKNVAHVLSDKPLTQGCLSDPTVVTQAQTTFYIYSVLQR